MQGREMIAAAKGGRQVVKVVMTKEQSGDAAAGN